MKDKKRLVLSKLNKSAYLQSMMYVGLRTNIYSDNDIARIQLGCLELLEQKLIQYFGDHSSSVREEEAQQLMTSITYTIGLALKTEHDTDKAAEFLKQADMSALYVLGQKQISSMLQKLQAMQATLKTTRISFDNSFYQETIDNLLPCFFKKYNPELSAHVCHPLPEYPVDLVINDLLGIELIYAYTESLIIENSFCGMFSRYELIELQKHYYEQIGNAPCNIYHFVLRTVTARLLTSNSMDINASQVNIGLLEKKLIGKSVSEIRGLLLNVYNKIELFERFENANQQYIVRSLHGLATEFYHALQGEFLETLFFPISKKVGLYDFYVSPPIDGLQYRKVLNQLFQTVDFSARLKILLEHTNSPDDFIGLLLDAEFEPNEIQAALESLDNLTLAVIFKHCKLLQEYDFYANDNKSQMFYKLLEKTLNHIGGRKVQVEAISDELEFK